MTEPAQPAEATLQHERETVRRAMLRTNTAMAAILGAVLILALTAVLAGVRAWRSQQRAERSEQAGREQLWQSYLEQARANRLSEQAGFRNRALTAISNAAAIRPALELRNEAIGCLSLPDLVETSPPHPPGDGDVRLHDVAPDFRQFARVVRSGLTQLRRTPDDELLATLDPASVGLGTNRVVTWAAFSPDGRFFGVGYLDSALVLWRLADAQAVRVRTLPGPGYLVPPVFSPDGRWFAHQDSTLPGGGGLALYELATGHELEVPGLGSYYASAVAPHRPWIALGSGRQVRVVHCETRETLRALDHPADVGRLEWSHDGRRLAVACVHGDVFLWDFDPEHFHVLTGHAEFVGTVAFSPDDRLLLTAGLDGTTRLWDCNQGQALLQTSDGQALRFDNQGSQIGFVRGTNGVGTWRWVPPQSLRTLHVRASGNEPNRPFDLSPSGRWLAAMAPQGVQVWDLTSSNRTWLEPFPAHTNRQRFPSWSVTLGPAEDGLLVCYGGRLEWWAFVTDAEGLANGFGVRRLVPLPGEAEARQATLSLDGRTILVEQHDLRLAVLDLEGERPPVRLAGQGRLFYPSLAGSSTGSGRFVISPDGHWAVVGKDVGPRSGPTVWDTRTGQIVAEFDAGGLAGFSPDGAWLGSSAAGRYFHRQVEGWQTTQVFEPPALAGIAGFFAWPRDHRWFAAAQSRQAVQVMDARDGSPLALLAMPHRQSASGMRLSHDGSRLVVTTPRHALHVWDLDRLRQELAAWNLDWSEAGPTQPTPPGSARPLVASGWRNPSMLVLLGLSLVIVAAVVAAGVLRRHRAAILQFVRSEALAEERRRELEGARIELLHSQKMKALGTLAAGIAHDFNNLLSVVRMSNRLIGREVPDNPEVREHVETIEEAVLQGKHVVGSMLGYSRPAPDSGTSRDVDEVVEETLALLSKEFLSGITLTLELDRSLPPGALGGGKLEQILLNLIVNASEAMQGRGRLRLATRLRDHVEAGSLVLAPHPAPRWIELAVEDNGPGIPQHIRERIFEPFFTTKRDSRRPGTGLGLSLVYTIAQQERLGLALDTAPGTGTRFRVLIPVATA